MCQRPGRRVYQLPPQWGPGADDRLEVTPARIPSNLGLLHSVHLTGTLRPTQLPVTEHQCKGSGTRRDSCQAFQSASQACLGSVEEERSERCDELPEVTERGSHRMRPAGPCTSSLPPASLRLRDGGATPQISARSLSATPILSTGLGVGTDEPPPAQPGGWSSCSHAWPPR